MDHFTGENLFLVHICIYIIIISLQNALHTLHKLWKILQNKNWFFTYPMLCTAEYIFLVHICTYIIIISLQNALNTLHKLWKILQNKNWFLKYPMMCTAKHIFLVIYAYTLLSYLSRMPSTHSTNSGTFYRIKTGSLHIQCCVQLSTYSQYIYAYTLLSYLSSMPFTHSTNSGKF